MHATIATKHIFISYKRAEPTTAVAELLDKRIRVNLSAYGFAQPFFDKHSIEAGHPWSPAIDQALARTTHFIALLSDDYWLSEQCQRELREAVRLYELTGTPRLLFVLTEKMDPNALRMDSAGSATVVTPFPTVEHLGQINFLGPYDKAGQLIALDCVNLQVLKDQLFDLVQAIKSLS